MIILSLSEFRKAFKKLPKRVQLAPIEREKIFKGNPFDPRLDTHKLHGKYKKYWSFTVVGQYRIMFAFSGSDIVEFLDIGTHDIYK